MVREVEDGKSKWGARLKEGWKELGVKSRGGWCNEVKDRGWLASKLGASKKKRKRKKKEDSRTITSNAAERLARAMFSSAGDFELNYFALARRRGEREASYREGLS